jgi:hypothetical protein
MQRDGINYFPQRQKTTLPNLTAVTDFRIQRRLLQSKISSAVDKADPKVATRDMNIRSRFGEEELIESVVRAYAL